MTWRYAHNCLRAHQGPLVVLAVLILGILLCATVAAHEWLATAIGVVAVGVIIATNLRGLRLASRMGLGLRYYEDTHHAHADAALEDAWKCAQSFDVHDPRRAALLEMWAAVKRARGDYTEAETKYVQAIAVDEQAWGVDHECTLAAQTHLADTYIDIARYRKAENLLRGVLEVRESRSGDSVAVANLLHMLSRVCLEQGRTADAEPMSRRALAIVQRNVRDPLDRLLRECVMQLAMVELALDQIGEAESLLEALVTRVEKMVRENHPLGQCLHALAAVRLRQGRLIEAEQLERRAISLIGRRLGGEQLGLAPGLCQLGEILTAQRRFDDAETFCLQALKLREEYLAPEHPALAESLENYANLLERMGRGVEAHPHRHRAEQIRAYHASLPGT